ncbi:pyrimidine reductase family protein [Planosporangium sp. 12N6]|uniref:pyrimidine reductase family protein n=1 Tax=Planosporangium spinosum TaxID=3402278 RepID=UPI003CF72039
MRLLMNDLGATIEAGPGEPLDRAALSRLYAYPAGAGDRPWVRANFVSTLDGAVAGADGRTGSINTGADHEVFTLLRALADVIVVGAGTARVEGYRRPVAAERWRGLGLRRGRPDHPALVVVSRSAVLPETLYETSGESGEVLLATCAAAGTDAIRRAARHLGADRVIVQGGPGVDVAAALDDLAGQGLTRILCEGGPRLLHDVVAADRLDELCLTVTPEMVAGTQPRILVGPDLRAPLVPRLLIESDGTLLGRWIRPGESTS